MKINDKGSDSKISVAALLFYPGRGFYEKYYD